MTSANLTLVKDGWCWWYRKYALGDTVLERLEERRRERRREACGLIRFPCRRGSGDGTETKGIGYVPRLDTYPTVGLAFQLV